MKVGLHLLCYEIYIRRNIRIWLFWKSNLRGPYTKDFFCFDVRIIITIFTPCYICLKIRRYWVDFAQIPSNPSPPFNGQKSVNIELLSLRKIKN